MGFPLRLRAAEMVGGSLPSPCLRGRSLWAPPGQTQACTYTHTHTYVRTHAHPNKESGAESTLRRWYGKKEAGGSSAWGRGIQSPGNMPGLEHEERREAGLMAGCPQGAQGRSHPQGRLERTGAGVRHPLSAPGTRRRPVPGVGGATGQKASASLYTGLQRWCDTEGPTGS